MNPNAAVTYDLDTSHPPAAANTAAFVFGAARNPAGVEITADGVSLLENGRPIVPVMGEFHYSRYPRGEWRDELLKMKAGGIDVVATYVFWIHHEETEGEFDFTGDRDLRAFVKLVGDIGLRCVVRCGPWCHGEVRNGGLPEWLVNKPVNLRTNDPAYLAEAARLYDAIAGQLRGLLWKDGGPVIGVQIENEYGGSPDHLVTLKNLAIEAGLDVPIYTRTGWPELQGPMPFGELLPLYGGYAEGFWDRELTTMPWRYRHEFKFSRVRTDAAIANEHFGDREARDDADTARYPYLTCELGAGMMCSYHRRINVVPTDALSMAIVKLGSGSNCPGYYMYHGGTNPAGREPWLQEHQATRLTNYNDLPVKTYDFQTALGEFGQVREQYHLLRPLHLFLRDFGERLAGLAVVLPTPTDADALRYAVRTDGRRGFVFVNNYERRLPQPARPETRLTLKLTGGELAFPPTTIAADRPFFWPFNLDLGDGVTLAYATAQLICQIRDRDACYTVFARTGNAAAFAIEGGPTIADAPPALAPVLTVTADNGVTHHILLLDEATAATAYKVRLAGQERLVLTATDVVFDGDAIRCSVIDGTGATVALLPGVTTMRADGEPVAGHPDGAFTQYMIAADPFAPLAATITAVRGAGPLRTIELGVAKVAAQPSDTDFAAAAEWHIALPAGLDLKRQYLLRVGYTGDVARAYLGDRLLTDNFFNGTPFDIGVNRFGEELITKGLTLKILPMQKDAPIYLHDSVRPDFGTAAALVELHGVELIGRKTIKLTVS